MNLYVGNLSWGIDDDSLRTFFESYGEVTDARVI
ncbi:MAG: RNA-binding protein, partial [Candidatus Sabulitectum sp.]|nr:RNA-binding protein [Candidatus Sabulitectum sp.]